MEFIPLELGLKSPVPDDLYSYGYLEVVKQVFIAGLKPKPYTLEYGVARWPRFSMTGGGEPPGHLPPRNLCSNGMFQIY